MNNMWKCAILVVFLVLLDQITKGIIQSNFSLGESLIVIDGFFGITYVRNPGAAFGFLASAPESIRRPLFIFIPVLACIWLCYLIWSNRKNSWLQWGTYGLILAGAVGNLFDRFTLGYVVDFLDFYYKSYHFPAFNVADSAITVAAVALVIEYFIAQKNSKQSPQNK